MTGHAFRYAIIILFSSLALSCGVKNLQVNETFQTEIQHIDISEGTGETIVILEGQEPMIYTTFRLHNPDRLVIDMAEVGLGQYQDEIVLEKGPIRSIRPKVGERSRVSRLEFELTGGAETNVRTEGLKLIVQVSLPAGEVEEESESAKGFVFFDEERAPSSEKSSEERPEEEVQDILSLLIKEEGTRLVEEALSPPAKTVSGIRFDDQEGLALVVTADGRLDPEIFLLGQDRLVIDLANTTTTTKERLIAARDPAVKQVRIGQHPDKLRLVVDLLSPIQYSWHQGEKKLRIQLESLHKGDKQPVPFFPPSPPREEASSSPLITPVQSKEGLVAPAKMVAASPAEKVIKKPSKKVILRPAPVSPKQKQVVKMVKKAKVERSSEGAETSAKPKFTGKKISLDFQDADITDMIRLIADVSKMNIVMGDDVKGKVTLKLINVPWDQALEIVLKMNNLGEIREGNILRISTLANITRQQDEEARAKETKVRAEDLVTKIFRINYAKADELQNTVSKLLSPRGDITVDDRTNAIIVKDIEKNIREVGGLIRKLDTQTPQVMIEARIVQIKPNFRRELGIQWGAETSGVNNNSRFTLSNTTGAFNAGISDFAVNVPAGFNLGGIGFTFGRIGAGNPFNLDLRLSAGESQGLTRIISTPKIAVLDNEEAKIQQGESIPFQTTSDQGTQTQFIDANLSLTVTPHISPDGGIVMDIKISKNAPGDTIPGAAGPSILKKEATTKILIQDGETAVIGGIYETDEAESISGIPYLMDIPFLGWLFKRTETRENTSELLVFITPTIMK
ncbi:MAG: type IV pilus secretin PilQ [Nitrospira sp.]|nr:type IV pilus secretin family protein [Candidatus Manganitrophaceae bacterium]HIL34205.1 type IV pilus secretin family protein [Candidatus Manganitrophaceae bacterium]